MVVTDDLNRNRLTVLFRLLLAIPHLIWLVLWGIVVFWAAVAAWVVALVTGRVPDGLHDFMAAYNRYYTHLDAYLWIAADPYPGFTGAPGYPVDVEIAPPVEQSRLTIVVRILLAIPALIVTSVLQNVAWIVAILAWFLALFTGRMSQGMRDRAGLLPALPGPDLRLPPAPHAAVPELLGRVTPRGSRSSTTTRAASRSASSRAASRLCRARRSSNVAASRSERLDRYRRLLVFEPRGHADMYGATSSH